MNALPIAAPFAASRKRVLHVDDEPSFTSLLKAGLEKTGHYQVAPCNDPSTAFQMVTDLRPDAILLDLEMPGKDGSELFHDLQADPWLRKIPTIIFTGLICSHEVSGQGYTSCGGMLLMSKLVGIDQIHACLTQLFEGALVKALPRQPTWCHWLA